MLTESQKSWLLQGEREIDEVLEEEDEVVPFRYRVSSQGKDLDVDGIVKRLDSGDIVVPEFQRGYVWSKKQASRFVESLLLGLPVPNVFLAVEPDTQRWLVIDGQQRLRTLQYFWNSQWPRTKRPFALSGVQEEFEGKCFPDLDQSDQRRLRNTSIHAIIVQQDEPSEDSSSIYHIFERLNTSGVSLTPHEIRTALNRGPFADLLRDLNRNEHWRQIYGPVNRFMRDQELILRFLAFYYGHERYQRPMKQFLTAFMGKHKRLDRIPEPEMRSVFEGAIRLLYDTLGRRAFRVSKAFNAVVFDSVMVAVAKRLSTGPVVDVAGLRARYDRLVSSDAFMRLTTSATADADSVSRRLALAEEAFAAVR